MAKNKQRDYEKEADEAIKRLKKHPEYLEASMNNKKFLDFLDNIGVNPDTYESEKGGNFWESVRQKIEEREIGFTASQLTEVKVKIITGLFRDTKGHFTTTKTDKPILSFRDLSTGKFIGKRGIKAKRLEKDLQS